MAGPPPPPPAEHPHHHHHQQQPYSCVDCPLFPIESGTLQKILDPKAADWDGFAKSVGDVNEPMKERDVFRKIRYSESMDGWTRADGQTDRQTDSKEGGGGGSSSPMCRVSCVVCAVCLSIHPSVLGRSCLGQDLLVQTRRALRKACHPTHAHDEWLDSGGSCL